MIENTLYMIKPEAFSKRDKIRQDFIRYGFRIKSYFVTQLSMEVLIFFYNSKPINLKKIMEIYGPFANVELGILQKQNAIKDLLNLAGTHFNPMLCSKHTIRYRYGNKILYEKNFFFNGIHRSSSNVEFNKELDFYENLFYFNKIEKQTIKFVKSKIDSEYRWSYHIKPVVKNSKLLIHILNLKNIFPDREIVILSSYLHDITRVENRKEHHITGSKLASVFLSNLNFNKNKIKKISECIYQHRGSIDINDSISLESEILRNADAMSHIQYATIMFYNAYSNKSLSLIDGIEKIHSKIKQSRKKITIPEAENIIKDKYHSLLQILMEINIKY